MDVHTPEQRSRNMSAIRSKDTKIERILAKELFSRGHRYRKNDKSVYGKPDLVFKGCKVAVFVDSEYFHGKDWEHQKHRIKSNRDFWWKKIESNIARDLKVQEKLHSEGWIILRFWGDEVKKNLSYCISKIEQAITERRDGKVFRGKR